jgi:hypothetical protein
MIPMIALDAAQILIEQTGPTVASKCAYYWLAFHNGVVSGPAQFLITF